MKEIFFAFLAGFGAALLMVLTSTEWMITVLQPHWISNVKVPVPSASSSSRTSAIGGSRVSHPLGKEGFVWPSQALGIPERKATERPWSTPALSLPDFISVLIRNGRTPHGFVVNVGAADGCLLELKECDEANQLLPIEVELAEDDVRSRNPELYQSVAFQGVLFEPTSAIKYHKDVYVEDAYTVIPTPLSYFNAVQSFQDAEIPTEFDVLKYDTDSADCAVIDALLAAGYLPSIVMAEYNIVFPPPLRFNFHASPKGMFHWGEVAPLPQQVGDQCSLSYLSDILTRHGYTLVQVDWWDAVYIRDHLVYLFTGGAPIYDDLTWYLHGYAANSPSESERLQFLLQTAYASMLGGVAETWLHTIAEASRMDLPEPLDLEQQVAMRTDFWWLAVKDGYVQVKATELIRERDACHDGCYPQPFSLT